MYAVSEYLSMLRLAKRSEQTLKNYESVLSSYAAFLDIPLESIHNHLTAEDLVKYAGSRRGKSERGTQSNLSILRRYMEINGVQFDTMEMNVIKTRCTEQPGDKPLELETLQRMMDLGNTHAKAIIITLISTGMRAGECSKLLVSDLDGDTITIPNSISKGGRGGKVYLTKEAREYLDVWLKDRARHIRNGRTSSRNFGRSLQPNDKRLFACTYNSMQKMFALLYRKVDGERGKYHDCCTLHSCRKYFRTHAVRLIPLDVVEKIMRHSGYLTNSYVRISDEETRRQFHAGEAALYVTRPDQRVSQGEIELLRRERDEQGGEISRLREDMELLRKVVVEIGRGK